MDKRRLIIITFSTIAAIIIVGIVFIVWKNAKELQGDRAVNLPQTLQECAVAQDPERCKALALTGAVKDGGGAELCDELKGKGLENCVRAAAGKSGKESTCNILDGEAKVKCEDDVRLDIARAELSLEKCDKVSDEGLRALCKENITAIIVQSGKCAENGVEKELCDARDISSRALNALDATICAEFSNEEDEVACEEEVAIYKGQTDEDKDGLSLDEEARFGTNPLKADTDGDGFSDGDEVQAGYNPNGSGKL